MSCAAWQGRVLASLVIAMVLADDGFAAPATSLSTPEAAVRHFVKCLAADDLDGAMQAFQIDKLLAQVDVNVSARLKDRPASSYRTLARVAKINVLAEIASAARRFVYGLLLDETADKLTEASDANLDRFTRAVDPARLRAVRIVRIDLPVPTIMNSAAGIRSGNEHAATLGAEEWTERIALFQLGGAYYEGGFTLLRYGTTWRIARLESIYGRVGTHERPVKKTTVQHYEELAK